MAVLKKEEFIERIKAIVGDDVSDDSLQLIEDLTDTYTDLETKSSGTGEWEEKYNKLDSEWRNKYKERFFSNGEVEEKVDDIIDTEMQEHEETIDYEDILTEVM